MSATPEQAIVCPACGGVNPADAVFCGNTKCHKALGGFRYVLEEVEADSSRIERLADHVTDFVGKPHFITIHVVWFLIWAALNSGLIAFIVVFDVYPYGLLGIILGIEASLITSFLLISNNRQNAHAEKRAELDYEVKVRSYRKLLELERVVAELRRQVQSPGS
jgi:uncharacterized membrane protein